jgi:hypothetical protein
LAALPQHKTYRKNMNWGDLTDIPTWVLNRIYFVLLINVLLHKKIDTKETNTLDVESEKINKCLAGLSQHKTYRKNMIWGDLTEIQTWVLNRIEFFMLITWYNPIFCLKVWVARHIYVINTFCICFYCTLLSAPCVMADLFVWTTVSFVIPF